MRALLQRGLDEPLERVADAALLVVQAFEGALLGLAEAYRAQGRDADAIRRYERYLAEHPDGEEAAVARNAIAELRR